MGIGKERKRHPVWEYFECIDEKGGEKAKCLLCKRKTVKIVASSTAMKKHLKSFHHKEEKLLDERVKLFEKSRRDSKAKRADEQTKIAEASGLARAFEESKHAKKYSATNPRSEKFM